MYYGFILFMQEIARYIICSLIQNCIGTQDAITNERLLNKRMNKKCSTKPTALYSSTTHTDHVHNCCTWVIDAGDCATKCNNIIFCQCCAVFPRTTTVGQEEFHATASAAAFSPPQAEEPLPLAPPHQHAHTRPPERQYYLPTSPLVDVGPRSPLK